jgi:hypothetical protein
MKPSSSSDEVLGGHVVIAAESEELYCHANGMKLTDSHTHLDSNGSSLALVRDWGHFTSTISRQEVKLLQHCTQRVQFEWQVQFTFWTSHIPQCVIFPKTVHFLKSLSHRCDWVTGGHRSHRVTGVTGVALLSYRSHTSHMSHNCVTRKFRKTKRGKITPHTSHSSQPCHRCHKCHKKVSQDKKRENDRLCIPRS